MMRVENLKKCPWCDVVLEARVIGVSIELPDRELTDIDKLYLHEKESRVNANSTIHCCPNCAYCESENVPRYQKKTKKIIGIEK